MRRTGTGVPGLSFPRSRVRLLDPQDVVHFDVSQRLFRTGRPRDFNAVDLSGAPEPEVQPQIVLRVISRAAHHLTDLRACGSDDTDARSNRASVRACANAFQ